MIGKVYAERGEPVVVRIRWGPGGGPRNVLVERLDGSRVVRPFRGLRRSTPKQRELWTRSRFGPRLPRSEPVRRVYASPTPLRRSTPIGTAHPTRDARP